jgi:CheY-like chemotaxis protein
MMSLDPKLRYQTPSQLLDAVRAARRELEEPSPNGPPAPVERTVFVVESDERLQNAMRDKFKKLGYRVLLAADPGRAIDRYRQQPFDALVLDAGATGAEGRAVFEKILGEAERHRHRFAGLLILSEDQAGWVEELAAQQRVRILVRPHVTLKKVHEALQELVPLPNKAEMITK